MSRILAYEPNHPQPCISAQFSITCAQHLDWVHANTWLVKHFAVPEYWLGDTRGPAPLNATLRSTAHRLLLASLALYAVLAKAGRIPVFEPGQILELSADPHQREGWKARVTLPFADGLPQAIAPNLLEQTIRVVSTVASLPATAENVQKMYATLDRELVQKMMAQIPGGKSTVPVCQVAHKLNIPFRHQGGGLIQLGWGAKSQWMDRSACRQDAATGARLSMDKQFTASLLGRAGLPAPEHLRADSADKARSAAAQLGWPVVVKPADRDRGEGVSVNIVNDAQLLEAYEKARALSVHVLVERQVAGICHRLFVVGEELIVAAKRLPKSVKGDGQKTVAELVVQENEELAKQAPWERKKPFLLDDMAVECLRKAGFSTSSVPLKDQFAPLRPIESTEWGGVVEDMMVHIHPDNVRAAVDAAAALGLRVAGVDMISTDISQPWHSNGAIINEVNFAPFFGGNMDSPKTSHFLQALVDGDGRIPVWALVGCGDLFEAGKSLQAELLAQGLQAFVTSAGRTENAQGDALPLRCNSLFDRCIALTMNLRVQAMVMLVDSDELLRTGMPLDRIDKVFIDPASATAESQAWSEQLLRHAPPGALHTLPKA